MNITFAPRGILQIDDAVLPYAYRNFAGEGSKYNREGDRNFVVAIDDRDLTQEEVDNILDIYREAEMVDNGDGPVLMFDGTEIITLPDMLQALGWNIKIKPPRDEDDDRFIFLSVKIKFNDRGPNVHLVTGRRHNILSEDSVDCLDRIDMANVELDIRPYDWDVNGKTGRTAYLQSMHVVQDVSDRFADRYADREE